MGFEVVEKMEVLLETEEQTPISQAYVWPDPFARFRPCLTRLLSSPMESKSYHSRAVYLSIIVMTEIITIVYYKL